MAATAFMETSSGTQQQPTACEPADREKVITWFMDADGVHPAEAGGPTTAGGGGGASSSSSSAAHMVDVVVVEQQHRPATRPTEIPAVTSAGEMVVCSAEDNNRRDCAPVSAAVIEPCSSVLSFEVAGSVDQDVPDDLPEVSRKRSSLDMVSDDVSLSLASESGVTVCDTLPAATSAPLPSSCEAPLPAASRAPFIVRSSSDSNGTTTNTTTTVMTSTMSGWSTRTSGCWTSPVTTFTAGARPFSNYPPISAKTSPLRHHRSLQIRAGPVGACNNGAVAGPSQPTVAAGSAAAATMAKHLQTEQVMSRHTLKARLSRYQTFIDHAFNMLEAELKDAWIEGFTIVSKLMDKAWDVPRIGHDLGYHLCDYMRERGYLAVIIRHLLDEDLTADIHLSAALALENSMSLGNRQYIVAQQQLVPLMNVLIKQFSETEYMVRVAVAIIDNMFKVSADVCTQMVDLGVLDFILNVCKAHKPDDHEVCLTLRHVASAIANMCVCSDAHCLQKTIAKKLPDWLFLLASSRDDITSYYACMAVCMLASNKEAESAVLKSGTLALVEPFLQRHKPEAFIKSDHKLAQGRPREWLCKMVGLLTASRREVNALAAFHFCMEGVIKRSQDRLELFQDIGAVSALKNLASSPSELSAKLASQALTVIGEAVPYKLSQQVPLWSVDDVVYWVRKIGFESHANAFREQMVDGDLLLLLTETELKEDVGMHSALLRKRFMRELDGLKIAADYSSVDPTELDSFLMSVSDDLSVYTYQMLEAGVDRSMLPALTDDMLTHTCSIANPVHRIKLLHALQDCKTMEDMEIAVLSKQIDIFISYRRRDGNQMASLLKVLLQLRGYKVFIDVDRLYAGQFDASLLKHIQAARHFVLVLTERALDRWTEPDAVAEDWVYKEVRCALENKKNIVPIFDANFEYPDECRLPADVRLLTKFNGIRWVHEYQEACVDKLEKFLRGEYNHTNSLTKRSRDHRDSIAFKNIAPFYEEEPAGYARMFSQ